MLSFTRLAGFRNRSKLGKRKRRNSSSNTDSKLNERPEEVEKNVGSPSKSASSGSMSSFDFCEDLKADSEGFSSDYDFCEDSDSGDKNSTLDLCMKTLKAESSGPVSEREPDDKDFCKEIVAIDENSIGRSMKRFKAASSTAVSEHECDDKDVCEDIDAVEKASVDENVKNFISESSGADSEFKSDGDEDNGSAEGMDIPEFYIGAGDEDIQFVEEIKVPPYHEVTDDQEFKQIRLRDIVKEQAFPLLPAKSLTRFRSVSKQWDGWIKAPFLSHMQSYKFRNMSGYFHESNNGVVSFISLCRPAYGVPDPTLRFIPNQPAGSLDRNLSIMSSSNGLLLCRTTNEDITYYVCNPATKQWKELPQPNNYHGEDPSIVLAFEPSVLNMEAHYKLVCAFELLGEPVMAFEVYSSETNSWKFVDDLCGELTDTNLMKDGFYFNGVAYWETTSNKVLAFDLNSEVHGVLPLPNGLPNNGTLAQMKGELCYVCAERLNEREIEVSFYMGLDNMSFKRSICFELEIQLALEFRVLPGLTADDTVMIKAQNCIYECNVNDKTVKMVATGSFRNGGKYLPYVNSLVSVA